MMSFKKATLYTVETSYNEVRESVESLQRVKDISVNIVTRTINEIEEGFKGNYPKLNGFTLEKNIAKRNVIEVDNIHYRVIYVDTIPRLTTLYLEMM